VVHLSFSYRVCFGAWIALSVWPAPPSLWAQPLLLGAYSRNHELVSINPATGQATPLFPLVPETFADLAWDPNHGVLYGATTSNHSLYRIDLGAETVTLIGHFPVGVQFMHGLEYDSNHDVLYGITNQSVLPALFRVNVNDASTTMVGAHHFPMLNDLAFDPVNGIMYATLPLQLRTINLSTGATTVVGNYNYPSGLNIGTGLAYDPQLGMFATDNGLGKVPDALYSLDPATGQATFIGLSGLVPDPNLLGLTFVPEPAGGAAVACTVVMVAAACRRRNALNSHRVRPHSDAGKCSLTDAGQPTS
jgi:hypothetical protein